MALSPGNEGDSALCPPWVVRNSNLAPGCTIRAIKYPSHCFLRVVALQMCGNNKLAWITFTIVMQFQTNSISTANVRLKGEKQQRAR